MGTFQHNAIIVITHDEKSIKKLDNFIKSVKSKGLGKNRVYYKNLFIKTEGLANGYVSYFVAPDGSKEGWDVSNEMDNLRKRFLKLAKTTYEYNQIIEISVGEIEDAITLNGITREFN